MKKLIQFSMLACIMFSFSSCFHYVDVDGGHEAVLIEQPAIFGHGGVDNTPVSSGTELVASTTKEVIFDITPVLYREDFQNVTCKGNNTIFISAYLKLQIRHGQTPQLYNDFGVKWYEKNIQENFRTMVRNKCSEHEMFALCSDRKILDSMQTLIKAQVQELITRLKIPVDVADLQIGQALPPDEVLKETHLTAAQNQAKLTQDARGNTEDARKNAEAKKAVADKAYMTGMGMTIEQYQHQRQLEIEKEKVELLLTSMGDKDHPKPNINISFISSAEKVVPTIPVK